MVLTLRHHNFQADLEGLTPQLWHDENYAVSESVPYRTDLQGGAQTAAILTRHGGTRE